MVVSEWYDLITHWSGLDSLISSRRLEAGYEHWLFFPVRECIEAGSVYSFIYYYWDIYLGMFREAFCQCVVKKGIAPNCEPLMYNTIMWRAWGHTFLCLLCATWKELKMRVGWLFFLLFFVVKASWMLVRDEFPATTGFWRWNVQFADAFLSLCLGTLGSSSILCWFSFEIQHCQNQTFCQQFQWLATFI